jgi:predicted SAM-dependent methyltransferase
MPVVLEEARRVDSLRTGVPTVTDRKKLLNLGCGAVVNPAFVNIDIAPAPGVIGCDLRHGIPFPDATYDFVYHSNVLCLLRSAEALGLMRECRRVLKPGGVLRVVTEDLEDMCRAYLQTLEEVCSGDHQSAKDYEWMLLELFDHPTREYPGGQMKEYLSQDPLPNEAFIYSRVGLRPRSRSCANHTGSGPPRRQFVSSLRARARKLILSALLGSQGVQALEIGSFRQSSGEAGYGFYDRYSLEQLFLSAGLSNISLRSVDESAYPFWDEVNLDITPEGEVVRPHALIVEGSRTADR